MDLIEAVSKGRMDSVHAMVDHGNDVFAMSEGSTLMHFAVKHQQLGAMEFLLKKGLDLNSKNANGETPLHLFVTSDTDEPRSLEMAEALIGRGADPFVKDKLGDTPMSRAQRLKKKALVQVLQSTNQVARVSTPSTAMSLHN